MPVIRKRTTIITTSDDPNSFSGVSETRSRGEAIYRRNEPPPEEYVPSEDSYDSESDDDL